MKKILLLILIFNIFLDAKYIREPIFNEVSYVQTFGNPNNEALVFVHGLGKEASSIWLESVEALKENYFIMIFDLPGFGKSDKSNKLYSPEKYVKFIDTLIDNFVDKPFHLIGHSMGASISLKYASLYQERLKSLTLIDAAGILHKIAYSEYLIKSKMKNVTSNDSISEMVSKVPQFLESIVPINVDTMVNYKVSRKVLFGSNPNTIAAMTLAEENFSRIPSKIKIPTLIMWGEKDETAPLRTGYALNKLIKNSKLEIIPNSKHTPMVDNFDIYLNLLKKHLKTKKYEKKKNVYEYSNTEIVLRKKQKEVLSGYFKRVEIFDSKNITLKNAYIEELKIYDSSVNIINSELDLGENSFIINSKVQITSSSIKLKTPIEINNSNFDLAAVNINSNTKAFYTNSEKKQEVICSLCIVNSKSKHGVYLIGYF